LRGSRQDQFKKEKAGKNKNENQAIEQVGGKTVVQLKQKDKLCPRGEKKKSRGHRRGKDDASHA